MNHTHPYQEIIEACRALFGPGCAVTERFLVSLHITKLRNIFRERALELHPDRARIVGVDHTVLTERFKNIQQAYQVLSEFISRGRHLSVGAAIDPQGTPPSSSTYVRDPGGRQKEPREHFWKGRMPAKELPLGQFLYYSGNISWESLIEAITWQRNQRPPFGRIARKWKYLDNLQIKDILTGRARGERIGDSAIRQGLMNQRQRNSVLGFQRWIQRPLGEFFVEKKILGSDEIHRIVHHQKKHNLNLKYTRV